ncbi:MAG: hypothetical protein ABSA18_10130 [Dehalococcoidia bacterium]
MVRPGHSGAQEVYCAHLCMGKYRWQRASDPRLDGGLRLGVSVGKVLLSSGG